MKKYIVMFGLTLVMAVLFSNVYAQSWPPPSPSFNEWGSSPDTWSYSRLGIVNDNPQAPLHIIWPLGGSVAIQERSINDAGGAALLMRKSRGNPASRLPALNNDVIGGLFGQAYDGGAFQPVATMRFFAEGNTTPTSSGGSIIFQTTPQGSTTLADRMIINAAGKVGIGVSVADMDDLGEAMLAVNGKILATEVEVKLKGDWPDFVFNSDYELMSLRDVEDYIAQNKHLPNVPSEADVRENGINVGEMSAILLQKVEELTLYVLELNKQNEELQKRIAELEK